MQNKLIFAQAENNPLCHSKFSKYLPLKIHLSRFIFYITIVIIHSSLPKHNSYFMGFLNGSKWFSKTNRYYFYTNAGSYRSYHQVLLSCYKLKVDLLAYSLTT